MDKEKIKEGLKMDGISIYKEARDRGLISAKTYKEVERIYKEEINDCTPSDCNPQRSE